jgi:probable HAF family extracellular repeat protein
MTIRQEKRIQILGEEKMKKEFVFVLAIVILLLTFVSTSFADSPSFQGLGSAPGYPYNRAYDVSADGLVVVGTMAGDSVFSYSQPFRWTKSGGFQHLGNLPGGEPRGRAKSVSADGLVVVGSSISASGWEAFYWQGGTMTGLGDLPGGTFSSEATGISADGSVVVGYGTSASGIEAFRWTYGGGMVGLGDLPGGSFYSQTGDVSADGSAIVGYSAVSWSNYEAFRWTASGGMQGLGRPGGRNSYAHGVSSDGSVIVGASSSVIGFEAVSWENGTVTGLGDLPGGYISSVASSVSADGEVVVGRGHTDSGNEAFIWDAANGMRNLKNVLVNDLGLDLIGWTLREAGGISADGLTIVGSGYNPSGIEQGWIATISEPAVNQPPILLAGLALFILDEVDSGNIDSELEGSLLVKVDAALSALDKDNPNAAKVAMNDLKALINQVEAQVDKKITPEAAAEIIQQANAIIVALGS